MKPVVLISRDRQRSATFIQAIQPYVSAVVCQSFIEFEYLDIPAIPDSEWLFFYSQKGVEAFHEAVIKNKWTIKHRIAAFGPQTAKYLSKQGYTPSFIGTAAGSSTADQFEPLAHGQKVVVIQGLHSKDSLRKNFKDPSNLDALVAYKNSPRAVPIHEKPDILCFTSPMNLATYFTANSYENNQEVICIGPSTAEAAIQQGITNFHIAKATSIASLAETVISLLTVKRQ